MARKSRSPCGHGLSYFMSIELVNSALLVIARPPVAKETLKSYLLHAAQQFGIFVYFSSLMQKETVGMQKETSLICKKKLA